MKSLMVAAVMLSVFLVPSANAERVNEQQSVVPAGLVKIKNLRGDLVVEGWDEAIVKVTGELDELAEGLRFEVNADITEIEVVMPRNNVNWGDGSDLKILVPNSSRVAISSVSTDIEVESVYGGLQVHTVSGDVSVKDVRKTTNLKSVSGSVETRKTIGKLRTQTSSGDIAIEKHQGDLDVESISGSVDIVVEQAGQLRANTVSGELDVKAQFLADVSAELMSVSGEIRVKLVEPISVTLNISSNSGDIDNDLSDDKVSTEYGMKSLMAELGRGEGTLTIRTVSGEIELEEG